MRYFAKAILCATGLLAPVTMADLLQCVDPDVAAVFLHSGYSPPPLITRELPEGFPAFNHPKGFKFIGSSVRATRTIIAFKTDLDLLAAEEAIAGGLEASGFKRQPKHQSTSLGFQTRKNLPLTMSLCREEDAPPIYVSTRHGTYVTVAVTDPRPGMATCRDYENSLHRMTNRFMPTLSLPPDSSGAMSSGSGSSNDNASSQVRFRTNYTGAQLLSFFNAQISDQGWTLNGEWTSDIGEGSMWSSERESYRLSGNLQVVAHNASEYTATFSVWQFD